MTAPNNISETPSPGSSSPEKNGEIPDVGKPESAKLGKTKSTARKKIGRPKGQPKTGGRKKPGPEPSGREARIYLEKNSGYLDMLVRLLKGKPIKRQGPTGKLVWYYPDFDDQKWALAQVLPRMIPTLASQELTGDSDNPLAFKDAGEPLSMTELARRTVYIFDKAAREADETRRVVAAPCGATAPAAGFASQPAVAPAPTSPVSGGFDPSIPGTHSEALGWVEGGPPPVTSGNGEAHHAARQPDREPIPGETADVGSYVVVCFEGGREGLPPQFEIRGSRGERLCTNPGGGWSGVLKWIEQKSPPGADLTVTIRKTRPIGSGSRPDERAARSISAPVVHGGYANRKRI